jgi:hypothetical protein
MGAKFSIAWAVAPPPPPRPLSWHAQERKELTAPYTSPCAPPVSVGSSEGSDSGNCSRAQHCFWSRVCVVEWITKRRDH